jgi:hypothetical protein
MKLEIGDRFLHAKEWDARTCKPKRCVVVQVTNERVYWRVDTRHSYKNATARKSFPLADIVLHVKAKIPFGL